MLERFRAFWQGRIFFMAIGDQLASFLNQILKDGVIVYHTQKSKRGMRAQVKLADFRRLRRAARQTHTRVHIMAKYGWPFIAARWWRRKGLLTGLAIIALVLTVLSQLVLSISVTGNHNVIAADVLQRAEKLGLKNWAYSQDLNLNQIAKALQDQLPDAAWVGVERNGTGVLIKISEKIRPTIPLEAGNLVASRAGIIKEIMVIQGIPQIHEGETVRAGQVLITQALNPSPPTTTSAPNAVPNPAVINPKSSQLTAPTSMARGFVRARVWYSAEKQVPLVEDTIEESGKLAIGWGIKFGSRVIMVTTQDSPFEQNNKEVTSHSLKLWRNWRFPVEVIRVKYKELHSVHLERSIAEACQLAEATARTEVQQKMTPGVLVVVENVKTIPNISGAERVRVEVETFEDLAVYANP
ncbi:MAG TPA: sporulation protein YqfD [Desulfosporosinus sp.]|nr:sporulation protein YqfD [Desulfosporosinus sp.]